MSFDEEYLEVFGGNIEAYNAIAQKLSDQYPSSNCNHDQKIGYKNGKVKCEDCGTLFSCDHDHKKETKDDVQCEDCGVIIKCKHTDKYKDNNGLYICRACGDELFELNFDPEWTYYGQSDNKRSADPARCHRSRSSNKEGVGKVFGELKLEVAAAIRAQVSIRYDKIVNGETVRGKSRRAIVAACLFHIYPEFGQVRTSDYIRSLFDLTKKRMSEGLRRYYATFPEATSFHIRPVDLLSWILTLTGIDKSHYRKIVCITRYLENSSRLLKRSSPQSVAAGIVYFYLCLNPKYKAELGLTKNKFAEKARLSDITVNKLVREAASISQCVITL